MTTLYIKTHESGLKYFGKTTQEDIHKYQGSGKYWKRHIKKYGYKVQTEILGIFENNSRELLEAALKFSKDNDIVTSKEWANLKEETGSNGGIGYKHTDETKNKVSLIMKSKNTSGSKGYKWTNKQKAKLIGRKSGTLGVKKSKEWKDKISETLKGHKHSDETKLKIARPGASNANAKQINIYNDNDELMFICNGNFNIICKENNLPHTAFSTSYKNEGKKLYENLGASRTKTLTENGWIKYVGWKALIIN